MHTVFVADNPAQAHLVSGLLSESGIRNYVDGEMLFGVRGDIGLTPESLPRVCVNDEDAARAVEVIRDKMTPPSEPSVAAESAGLRGFKHFLRVWVFLKIAAIAVVLGLFAAWLLSRRS